MQQATVVVIGHKDHGKSTLLGRFLYDSGAVKPDRIEELRRSSRRFGGALNFAFLLDSFEEERKDGLTIDIVPVPFKSRRYAYTLIDCPGHRELIKNMVTGASVARAALLVVSARRGEGIAAQTGDHVRLARMLGIRQIVAAVTKMDAAGYSRRRFALLAGKIRGLLSSAGYDGDTAPVVPVSAFDGENILKRSRRMRYAGGSLVEALDASIVPAPSPARKPLRILVQDVYRVGRKDIIVGKLVTGILRQGDDVLFLPTGTAGRVAGIRNGDRRRRRSAAGESVGIRIDTVSRQRPARGDVGIHAADAVPVPRRAFRSRMVWFAGRPRARKAYLFRLGTALVAGRIAGISGRFPDIEAAVTLDTGVFVETCAEMPPLGRFIVMDAGLVAGAGIVTGWDGHGDH